MKIESHCSVFSLVALLAGACVAEVGGEPGDEIIDDDTEDRDEHAEVDRAALELTEPERNIDDETPTNDGGLIAATLRNWSINVWYGAAGLSADFGDGDKPDLYVKRFCGGSYRNQTRVVSNSTGPFWNETLLSTATTDSYIKSCYMELWDADSNAHDYGGRVDLSGIADEMLRNGWTSITRKRTFTANDDVIVYFRLTRR